MKGMNGKRVLVVGLARSGRAVALCLQRRGARVMLSDVRPPGHFQELLPGLLAAKIGLELGLQREETFLRQDLVVVSPGVPWDLPQLEAAAWFLPGRLLGVTGSNGKTTTTTLLGEMLKSSGFATFVGGNIGVPLSSAVDAVPPPTMIVTELSSFQLEGIQEFHPHVAVMLNLTPNHQDRHPDFATYLRAKAQIFRNQTAQDYAILNADDPEVMTLAANIAGQKVLFSCRQNLPGGVMVEDGQVLYRVGYLERPLFKASELQLRGEFNLEDALAAAAAACVVGADFDAISQAVRAFRGVEHRLEYVATIRGVEFYNNSKATSVDATLKSLEAFERGVHLVIGGKDKGAPYAPLRPLLKHRVRAVYLIGAAAGRISEELSGTAELVPAGDLEAAVREAFSRAIPGETVLLAPACSSFDQFQDYEHRGRVFKELVHRLEQEPPVLTPGERKKSDVSPKTRAPARAATRIETPPPTRPEPAAKPELALPPVAPTMAEPETVPEPERRIEAELRRESERKVEAKKRGAGAKPEMRPEAAAECARLESLPEKIAEEAEMRVDDQTPAREGLTAGGAREEVDAEGISAFPAELPSAVSSLDEEKSLVGKEVTPAAPATVETSEESSGRVTVRPVKYLDFITVYEVAAEERPTSIQETSLISEVEPGALSTVASHSLEDVNDEPIPFEVRVAARGHSEDTQAAETIHPSSAPAMKAAKRRAQRDGAAEKGEAADEDSDPQGRLPGI